ncbi:MAG: MFS transporter [Hyphomonadaceae bacterium]|nr:MFS transporter [Hyphomonadaceae bacterium]
MNRCFAIRQFRTFSQTPTARAESQIRLATIAAAIASAGIALSQITAVTLVFMALGGFAWVLALTTFNSAIQLSSPRWVVGRSVGVGRVMTLGALALGAAACGGLASRFGLVSTCLTASAFLIASVFVPRTMIATTSEDLTPRNHDVRPPRVRLEANTGPLLIVVEYQASADQAERLLELLHELGRIRTRNGARNWCVAQDIDDPTRWVERFESPTWMDHLRRAGRATLADEVILSRAQEFRRDTKARRLVSRPPGAAPLSEEMPLPDRTLDS